MTPSLLVTDTHPLIYFFCGEQRRLSNNALLAFEGALTGAVTIFVPVPVLWEISMLVSKDHISLNQPFSDWVDSLFKIQMFVEAPFSGEVIKTLHQIRYHSDPFDRSIVATALHLDLPLITKDSKMHDAKPCEIYWD
ncbi:type II toxin-antitoxin system VapC family toxin [Candidatus Obscuribacterales bacterium]|nr:type II toxin-antitoxin system VapC family toxin [Candidatus Obscuribacterales bacterium]